jgi:hypothetical protein
LATDAAGLVGLLADPARRKVFAALVLGACTLDEVRTASGLSARAAGTALARLVDGELVLRAGDDHWVIEDAFRAAARDAASTHDHDDHAEASPDAAKVLRAFVRDGTLTSIPTSHAKRLVILDLLVQAFEPGVRYPERAVNAALRRWHPDTAALRRYLVDDGFLERAGGEYWRAGGTFTP